MKGLFIGAVLFFASCGGLPKLGLVSAQEQKLFEKDCLAVFQVGPWQVVHSIEANMAHGRGGVFLGLTVAHEGDGSSRSVLMSVEGMVLFDASFSEKKIVVHRALPPFDKKGFGEGLIADVRLVFFPPVGKIFAVGKLKTGERVCRWRRSSGETVEVLLKGSGGGWEIRAFDLGMAVVREVRASGVIRKGFATRTQLLAKDGANYSLELELLSVESGVGSER
ncbi:MAG: hypothetical protein V1754_08225 [Pseudomonadota bacterium]